MSYQPQFLLPFKERHLLTRGSARLQQIRKPTWNTQSRGSQTTLIHLDHAVGNLSPGLQLLQRNKSEAILEQWIHSRFLSQDFVAPTTWRLRKLGFQHPKMYKVEVELRSDLWSYNFWSAYCMVYHLAKRIKTQEFKSKWDMWFRYHVGLGEVASRGCFLFCCKTGSYVVQIASNLLCSRG